MSTALCKAYEEVVTRSNLAEGTDAEYAIIARRRDGDWTFHTKLSARNKIMVARGLLEDAVKQCDDYPEQCTPAGVRVMQDALQIGIELGEMLEDLDS